MATAANQTAKFPANPSADCMRVGHSQQAISQGVRLAPGRECKQQREGCGAEGGFTHLSCFCHSWPISRLTSRPFGSRCSSCSAPWAAAKVKSTARSDARSIAIPPPGSGRRRLNCSRAGCRRFLDAVLDDRQRQAAVLGRREPPEAAQRSWPDGAGLAASAGCSAACRRSAESDEARQVLNRGPRGCMSCMKRPVHPLG